MAETSRLVLEVNSQGFVEARGNLAAFTEAARDAGVSAEELERILNSVHHTAQQNSQSTATLGEALGSLNLSSIAAAAGLTQILNSLKQAGVAMTQTYSQFEQLESSLQGLMRSEEKGTALFEKLRAFSFDTTFGVDTLAAASQQLLSTGTSAQQLEKRLLMLGNVASGDTQKFNDLVSIFAKIQNTGKAGSMQLQQLALRGVPIYQMLKEIGVEGTATADQITEAFERMTGAGGEFEGAMDRINDTIQGKEGFVSDTMREVLSSFAEASGIADAYKLKLEIQFNILQTIVNIMQKINSNPIMKGAFTAVIITIAGALTGLVIPALWTVIAQMKIMATLKAAINPIGVAIGAVAGIAVAAGVLIAKAAKNAQKPIRDLNGEIVRTKQVSEEASRAIEKDGYYLDAEGDKYKLLIQDVKKYNEAVNDARKDVLEHFKDTDTGFVDYKKMRAALLSTNDEFGEEDLKNLALVMADTERRIRDYKKKINEASSDKDRKSAMSMYNLEIKHLEEYKNIQTEIKLKIDQQNEALRLQAKYQEESNRQIKKAAELQDELSKFYNNTTEGKRLLLTDKINQYENIARNQYRLENGWKQRPTFEILPGGNSVMKGTEWYQDYTNFSKEQVDAYLAYLRRELDNLGKSNGKTWKDLFKDVTGEDVSALSGDYLSDGKSLREGGLYAQQKAVIQYLNALDEAKKKQKEFNETVLMLKAPVTETEKLEATINENKEKIDELVKARQALVDKKNNAELTGGVFNNEGNKAIADLDQSIRQLSTDTLFAERKLKELLNQQEYDKKFKDARKSLEDELVVFGLIGKELYKQQYILEGFEEKEAIILATEKERLENMKKMADATYLQSKMQEKVQQAAEQYQKFKADGKDWNRADGMAEYLGIIGNYAAGTAGNAGLSMINGTDIGNFVTGVQQMGLLGGIINSLISSITNVIGGLDGIQLILNPITNALKEFEPVFKSTLLIFLVVSKGLIKLAEMLMSFLDKITGGWFSEMAGMWDELVDSVDDATSSTKDLSDSMKGLLDAVKEQEEYYLTKKRDLNAQSYINQLSATGVHDMILTPHGNFSTDPTDTLIAMKNPSALVGSGKVSMNVKIVNNAGVDVEARPQIGPDGMKELLVTISRKVASDMAQGANGWDGAMGAYQSRMSGRRVSL